MFIKLLHINYISKLADVLSAMFIHPASWVKISKNVTAGNDDSCLALGAISFASKVGAGRTRSP